ncbi:MAG: hypothetical protein R2747_11125 [Pyrinomonadaceae bacterium]
MEKETELKKLINVLRRTSRMAMHTEWTGGQEDTAPFCVEQYNRVLARLKELDETVGAIFSPLPEGSSLTVTAMACRQLCAYFEDEVGRHGWGWRGPKAYAFRYDAEAFKEFWKNSAHEFEDLGEYIREIIEEWFRVKKKDDKKEGDVSQEEKKKAEK